MKVFGIDPGSARTGYGCVQSDGSRHRMVVCGAIANPASNSFPEKLRVIHVELSVLIARHRPDIVAIENLFHAVNARSALKLGHARGVASVARDALGVDALIGLVALGSAIVLAVARVRAAARGAGLAALVPPSRAGRLLLLLVGTWTFVRWHASPGALARH